jgi:hypothetical protein
LERLAAVTALIAAQVRAARRQVAAEKQPIAIVAIPGAVILGVTYRNRSGRAVPLVRRFMLRVSDAGR